MERDTGTGIAEAMKGEKAALAFDGLDIIERATRDGCSPRALQDIVGNLLVLLAWLDDEKGALRLRPRAADQHVRALLADCLAKAGVPAHAVTDSLGLIRDCFGDDGLVAELNLDSSPPDAPLVD